MHQRSRNNRILEKRIIQTPLLEVKKNINQKPPPPPPKEEIKKPLEIKKLDNIPKISEIDIRDKVGYFSKQFFNETGVLDEFITENENKITVNAIISENQDINELIQFKRYNDWICRGKLIKYIRSIR